MARRRRKISALGVAETRGAGDVGIALRLLAQGASVDEIRLYLPWGGISPLGQEILNEARAKEARPER